MLSRKASESILRIKSSKKENKQVGKNIYSDIILNKIKI